MKRTTLTAAGALFAAAIASGASAQLSAYEGFGYGPIPNIGGANGGTGWTDAWYDYASALPASVSVPGLSYPNLVTTPGGASAPAGFLPDMMEYSRPVPVPSGNTEFVSMLIRPESPQASWFGLRVGAWPRQVDLGVPMGYYSYGFMIGDGFMVPSSVPTTVGRTELLVMEIIVDTAGSQTIYNLYVNPTIGAPQPAVPTLSYPRHLLIPLATPRIVLMGEGGFAFDEIRLGETWESVLPPAPPACYANCDGSTAAPVLNVLDFSCFLQRFAAGDAYANCDGSVQPPTLNVVDFSCFLVKYAAGCR